VNTDIRADIDIRPDNAISVWQNNMFISIIHTHIHYYGLSVLAIKTSTFNYQPKPSSKE